MPNQHVVAALALACLLGLTNAQVRTCPNSSQLSDRFSCTAGEDEPVCDYETSTTYRNRGCANCNGVLNYRSGSCSATGPNTIASCQDTQHVDASRCRTRSAEAVCYDGVDYFNHYCAFCAGASGSNISYTQCGQTSTVVSTCASSQSNACYNFAASPVCYNHVTYRNRGCAICNNVDATLPSAGACDSDYEPCDSQSCPANSFCTSTVVDCTFDGVDCGWQLDNGATITAASGSGYNDHTWGTTNTAASYVSLTAGGSMSAPALNVTSPECTMVFWVYSTVNPEMTISAAVGQNVRQQTALVSFTASQWSRVQVPLVNLPSGLTTLSITLNSDSLLSVDDVEISCADSQGIGDGACACDPGYFSVQENGVETCIPSLADAVEDNDHLSTFFAVLERSGLTSALSDQSLFFTVFAPTNAAFDAIDGSRVDQLLSNATAASAIVGFHISCVGNGLSWCDATVPAEYASTGLQNMQVRYENGERTLSSVEGSRISFSINFANNTFVVGTGQVVSEIAASNGNVLIIDAVQFPDDHPVPPNNSCGVYDCDQDSGNSVCRAVPAEPGTRDFVPFSLSQCPRCGGIIEGTDYVCGEDSNGEIKSYRSMCHMECIAQQRQVTINLLYSGQSCLQPTCVCERSFYRPVPGQPCVVAPSTTTSIPWNQPNFSMPTPEPLILPRLEFYMNGSFFRVVQSRRMMMDQVFTQLVREQFTQSAGLDNREISSLSMDVMPSSRMPGYILMEVRGPNQEALDRIEAAVGAGRVGVNFAHSNYQNDPNALIPTYFQAFPIDPETLPPIVSYSFWFDVTYEEIICRRDEFNACTDEFINQEDFAGGIRWHLRNSNGAYSLANDSLVFMWPYNSTRPGIVGKVEVLATALQMNAQLIVQLRTLVETSQSRVMLMDSTGLEDFNYPALPLPLDSINDREINLQATLGPYPGSSAIPPVGEVDVSQGPMNGQLYIRWSMTMNEAFAVGGIHIHTGTTCENASLVGGHYYSISVPDVDYATDDWEQYPDPWNAVMWNTDISNIAEGFATLYTGFTIAENDNHAVVVHSSSGARIGCGVLGHVTDVRVPSHDVADINDDDYVPSSADIHMTNESGSSGYKLGTFIGVLIIMVLIIAGLVAYYMVSKEQSKSLAQATKISESVSNPSYESPKQDTRVDMSQEEPNDLVDSAAEDPGYMHVEPSSPESTNPFA